MGKVEHIKQQRKLLEAEKQAIADQKKYRNKIFGMGFLAGLGVAIVIFLPLILKRPESTTPKIPSLGTSGTNVQVPANIQLPQGSAASEPLKLQP